jgi:hypothetical protein
MSVRIDDRWSYDGQPAIRIENEALAIDVLPLMGAKILNLIDKRNDRSVLWRNPRQRLRPGPMQADVDDYFAGGWDDAFPTGDPSHNEHGDQLPYMGEVWNLGLTPHVIEAGPREAVVAFDGLTPITPARWTRTLRLVAGEPLLTITTRIENVGYRPFAYCHGSHAALTVAEGMRLDVPAERGEIADAGSGGALGELGESYTYPLLRAGRPDERDIRRVAAPALGRHALHTLTGLSGGWAAATDPQTRTGFGIAFDERTHPAVWQWMSYGGFRGWYHAILEPWTSSQTSLEAARAAGEARTLQPGEVFETTMTGIVYRGVEHVAGLGVDGTVTAGRAAERDPSS